MLCIRLRWHFKAHTRIPVKNYKVLIGVWFLTCVFVKSIKNLSNVRVGNGLKCIVHTISLCKMDLCKWSSNGGFCHCYCFIVLERKVKLLWYFQISTFVQLISRRKNWSDKKYLSEREMDDFKFNVLLFFLTNHHLTDSYATQSKYNIQLIFSVRICEI